MTNIGSLVPSFLKGNDKIDGDLFHLASLCEVGGTL